MGSMVLDESADFVLILSDERYKIKVNSREGRVGTESLLRSTKMQKVLNLF